MNTTIIDTREAFEYEAGHVSGSVNIPPAAFMGSEIPQALKNKAKDDEIIVYCRSGSRSNVVAGILRQYGFTNIVNGINAGHVEKLLASR